MSFDAMGREGTTFGRAVSAATSIFGPAESRALLIEFPRLGR